MAAATADHHFLLRPSRAWWQHIPTPLSFRSLLTTYTHLHGAALPPAVHPVECVCPLSSLCVVLFSPLVSIFFAGSSHGGHVGRTRIAATECMRLSLQEVEDCQKMMCKSGWLGFVFRGHLDPARERFTAKERTKIFTGALDEVSFPLLPSFRGGGPCPLTVFSPGHPGWIRSLEAAGTADSALAQVRSPLAVFILQERLSPCFPSTIGPCLPFFIACFFFFGPCPLPQQVVHGAAAHGVHHARPHEGGSLGGQGRALQALRAAFSATLCLRGRGCSSGRGCPLVVSPLVLPQSVSDSVRVWAQGMRGGLFRQSAFQRNCISVLGQRELEDMTGDHWRPTLASFHFFVSPSLFRLSSLSAMHQTQP